MDYWTTLSFTIQILLAMGLANDHGKLIILITRASFLFTYFIKITNFNVILVLIKLKSLVINRLITKVNVHCTDITVSFYNTF